MCLLLEHEQKGQDVSFVSGVRPFKSANSLSCDVFADIFSLFVRLDLRSVNHFECL